MILNDAPYGSERSYNGLRLARSLLKTGEAEAKCSLSVTRPHAPNADRKCRRAITTLAMVARNGGEVGVCGSCLDARGIADADLIEGVSRSTMDQLTAWAQWADKVIVF